MTKYFVNFCILEGDTIDNHEHHSVELSIEANTIEEALFKAKSMISIEVSNTEMYSPDNQFRAYIGRTGETIRRN